MIAAGAPLPEVDLASVHGERVRSADRVGTTLVLVLATHRSVGRLDDWYAALTDALAGDPVEVLPVGILDGLPTFVPESAVRARLKQKSHAPVLMDTGGALARRLGIDADGAFVVVVGPDHVVRFAGDDLDPAAWAAIRAAVRAAPGTGTAT